MPTPAESPDTREGGCPPSLGPAGNVGEPRGEMLSPLCIPSVAKILNSLLPILYRQWQTALLQRTLPGNCQAGK